MISDSCNQKDVSSGVTGVTILVGSGGGLVNKFPIS